MWNWCFHGSVSSKKQNKQTSLLEDQSAFGYKNHLWHFQEKARVGWEQAISRVSVQICPYREQRAHTHTHTERTTSSAHRCKATSIKHVTQTQRWAQSMLTHSNEHRACAHRHTIPYSSTSPSINPHSISPGSQSAGWSFINRDKVETHTGVSVKCGISWVVAGDPTLYSTPKEVGGLAPSEALQS